MKRVLIILLVVLSHMFCMAQTAVQVNPDAVRTHWDELVNYVCCRYTNVYLQQYINHNKVSKTDKLSYTNIIKPKLDSQTIERSLTSHKVGELLSDNNWGTAAKKFVSSFDTLYKYPDKEKTLSRLLQTPLDDKTSDTQIWLSESVEQLHIEIINRYPLNNIEPNQNIQSQHSSEKRNQSQTPVSTNDNDGISTSYLIWLIIISIVLVFVVVTLILNIKNLNAKIDAIKTEPRSNRNDCSSTSQNISTFRAEISAISEKVNRIENQLIDVNQKISKIEISQQERGSSSKASMNGYASSSNSASDNVNSDDNYGGNSSSQVVASYIYLKPFRDGLMRECSEEDSLYKGVVNQDCVSFEFYCTPDKIATALNSVNATFDDVCNMNNYTSSAKSISNVSNGRAQLQSDGKWRVLNKCVVSFN